LTEATRRREIAVRPAGARVTIRFAGREIVSTDAALELLEGSYPPVLYVPRADADMAALERTDRSTHCPWKGDASYFSVVAGGERADNAVWSYEAPLEQVAAIRDHLAFYPDKVEVVREG
jgi:uncharacterized protein (DUF427 family)